MITRCPSCGSRSKTLLVLSCYLLIWRSVAQDNDSVLERVGNDEVSDSLAMWGLPDGTAIVGKFFQYHLPTNAFQGKATAYKVTESGSESLPTWLYFDDDTQMLEGVAIHDALGKFYYIEVTATTVNDGRETQSKDVFSIHVVEDSAFMTDTVAQTLREHTQLDESKPVKCLHGSAITTATVVIDADQDVLTPQASRDILRGMASHLGLPIDAFKMVIAGSLPVDDDSALVAGPGDVKVPVNTGLLVQWEVGCGNVFANHMKVLEQVEQSSVDGSMTNTVGHGVIGWHVTNKKPASTHRLKRQAIRPTQTEAVRPPTGRPVPTASSVFPTVKPTKVPEKTPKPKPTKAPKPTKPPKGKTTLPARLPTLEPSIPAGVPTKLAPTQPLPDDDNSPPYSQIPMFPPVVVVEGSIVQHIIPLGIFNDKEDGMDLTIEFRTIDGLELGPTSWISYNSMTSTVSGMPMAEHVGNVEFALTATDSGGKLAKIPVMVTVQRRPVTQKAAYEMSIALDLVYEKFMLDVSLRIDVATKISAAFGDSDSTKMSITSIAPGSVKYAWTNNTIGGDKCPTQEVEAVQRIFILPDGNLTKHFVEAIKPYKILNANYALKGSCAAKTPPGGPTAVPPGPGTGPPGPGQPTPQPSAQPSAGAVKPKPASTQLVTIIIPILIVIGLVILAATIACILIKRRRRNKKKPISDNHNNESFVKKGAPVIFANELDEKSNPPTKPLLSDENKPTQPPPNYQHATSTPRSQHRDLVASAPEELPQTSSDPPPAPDDQQPIFRNPPPDDINNIAPLVM